MQLRIIFPSGAEIESATVERASLPSRSGRFTVLRNHAPIVAALDRGNIVYSDAEGEHAVEISSGFCRVFSNLISVAAEK